MRSNSHLGNEMTVVVSFRAPTQLVEKLDDLAQGDQRTRANFLLRMLTNAISLEPGVRLIGDIIPNILREMEENPDSPQTEYYRGELRGAREAISGFFGRRASLWVEDRVRERSGLPIPPVNRLYKDGKRYGIDSAADIY